MALNVIIVVWVVALLCDSTVDNKCIGGNYSLFLFGIQDSITAKLGYSVSLKQSYQTTELHEP
jgi:hypothetical protein